MERASSLCRGVSAGGCLSFLHPVLWLAFSSLMNRLDAVFLRKASILSTAPVGADTTPGCDGRWHVCLFPSFDPFSKSGHPSCLRVFESFLDPLAHKLDGRIVWFRPDPFCLSVVSIEGPYRSLDPNVLEKVMMNKFLIDGLKHTL